MRIAMLTDDYPPRIGGIASHVWELTRALRAQGHDVRVWFWNPDYEPLASAEAPPLDRLRCRPRLPLPPALRRGHGLLGGLRERLADFEPDILHAHSLSPLSAAMRMLGPSNAYRRVFTNHSSGYLRMIQSPVGRFKARLYAGGFDGLLAPSRELLETSRLLGLGEERMAYLPNGVDIEAFVPGERAAARRALGLPPEAAIVLATRRFVPKNGLTQLALALPPLRERVAELLCVFCGNDEDPDEAQRVRQIVREGGLEGQVRFEGGVANDRIGLYLQAADVVALPSLVEATSISGLEAMACGRALVGTRVGGIPDLIEHGRSGLLCRPGDPADLAEKLAEALSQPALLHAMGEAARRRAVAQFSWQRIADRTRAFHERILDRPPRA